MELDILVNLNKFGLEHVRGACWLRFVWLRVCRPVVQAFAFRMVSGTLLLLDSGAPLWLPLARPGVA